MQKIRTLTGPLFFIGLALFWSLSFLAIRVSLTAFDPAFSTLLRVGIAFFTLFILFFFTKTPLKMPLKTSALLWTQGILAQALPFLLLFWGEQYIEPGFASIINATAPLWALMINGFILREKNTFTFKKTLGLIVGFIGIVTIFLPLVFAEDARNDTNTYMGILSVFGMAIFYAIAAIFYQKICTNMNFDFKASVWHQNMGSFAFVFIFSLLTNSWPTLQLSSFPLHAVLAVLYLGIFSTAFAFFMYSYLILEWGAVRAVSVVYVVPAFSVLWDILFLGLPVHIYELVGMCIILVGVFCVQRPEKDQVFQDENNEELTKNPTL